MKAQSRCDIAFRGILVSSREQKLFPFEKKKKQKNMVYPDTLSLHGLFTAGDVTD